MSLQERLARIAWWAAAPLACLFLYRYGLMTWFHQDDFAWLGQADWAQTWRDWLEVLLLPRAQGTIRPLSERLYFIALRGMFGLDPLPFRVVAFATQLASLALLQSIVRRATGSWTAALAAALLWVANAGLATPLGWSSSYNQLSCAFFLLAGLWMRQRRKPVWEWAAFLLGLGALEIGVVYPALALAYTWVFERERWRETLPMFGVSAAYAVLHRSLAPKVLEGPYALHWDFSMVQTLFHYLQMGLAGGFTHPRLARLGPESWLWAAWILTAAAAAYLSWAARKRDWSPWFGAAWFVMVLGPVLPLRDHVMDYYLATGGIGLAWLGGCAVRDAWARGWGWRAMTGAILAIYLLFSGLAARGSSRWRYMRAQQVEVLVEGIARAHELHPKATILLTGVTSDLFWFGVFDNPYRLYGANSVYLAPSAENTIEKHPELGDMAPFVLEESVAGRLLDQDLATVYDVQAGRLKNVTGRYRGYAEAWKKRMPRSVIASSTVFKDLLGPTWHEPEGTHRWMPGEATVRLGGPATGEEKLRLQGSCPAQLTREGPLRLTVAVDGQVVGTKQLTALDDAFDFSFTLPAKLVGKSEVTVRIAVDRTLRLEGDGREMGLAFGTISIR